MDGHPPRQSVQQQPLSDIRTRARRAHNLRPAEQLGISAPPHWAQKRALSGFSQEQEGQINCADGIRPYTSQTEMVGASRRAFSVAVGRAGNQ